MSAYFFILFYSIDEEYSFELTLLFKSLYTVYERL
jgi:hypothetical protein